MKLKLHMLKNDFRRMNPISGSSAEISEPFRDASELTGDRIQPMKHLLKLLNLGLQLLKHGFEPANASLRALNHRLQLTKGLLREMKYELRMANPFSEVLKVFSQLFSINYKL